MRPEHSVLTLCTLFLMFFAPPTFAEGYDVRVVAPSSSSFDSVVLSPRFRYLVQMGTGRRGPDFRMIDLRRRRVVHSIELPTIISTVFDVNDGGTVLATYSDALDSFYDSTLETFDIARGRRTIPLPPFTVVDWAAISNAGEVTVILEVDEAAPRLYFVNSNTELVPIDLGGFVSEFRSVIANGRGDLVAAISNNESAISGGKRVVIRTRDGKIKKLSLPSGGDYEVMAFDEHRRVLVKRTFGEDDRQEAYRVTAQGAKRITLPKNFAFPTEDEIAGNLRSTVVVGTWEDDDSDVLLASEGGTRLEEDYRADPMNCHLSGSSKIRVSTILARLPDGSYLGFGHSLRQTEPKDLIHITPSSRDTALSSCGKNFEVQFLDDTCSGYLGSHDVPKAHTYCSVKVLLSDSSGRALRNAQVAVRFNRHRKLASGRTGADGTAILRFDIAKCFSSECSICEVVGPDDDDRMMPNFQKLTISDCPA